MYFGVKRVDFLEYGNVHLDRGRNNVPADIMIAGFAAHIRIDAGLLTIIK
jgi:hypothetical protein